MSTIGQRISELRKNSSFSQEYVAEKLNVSRQAVSKWEQDLSAPDTYNLIALAELFVPCHITVERAINILALVLNSNADRKRLCIDRISGIKEHLIGVSRAVTGG